MNPVADLQRQYRSKLAWKMIVENINLVQWKLYNTNHSKHLTMIATQGDSAGLAHDCCIAMFQYLKHGKKPACKQSTFILNMTKWERLRQLDRATRDRDSFEEYQRETEYLYPSRERETEQPHEAYDRKELRERIEKALKTLTYRERHILKLRHGLMDGWSYSLNETARIFQVTRERIRQIESKAIKKLQHHTRTWYLEDFVEPPS